MDEGLSERAARARLWAVDRDGLILSDIPRLPDQQVKLARDAAEVAGWTLSGSHQIGLLDTVVNVRPTVLIGASGQMGAFGEPVVRAMAAGCERPVIFPLSNPISRAEAHPADLLAWTDGRALVGTGSPFGVEGVTQVNNVYIFPGVGLGAIAAGALAVTDGMFMAAARALGELGSMGNAAGLLPPIDRLRDVAQHIALVVAHQAVEDGVATLVRSVLTPEHIAGLMWSASYG
jgi:malate dehydrogenase (oxaloacetate-decarboxylating)